MDAGSWGTMQDSRKLRVIDQARLVLRLTYQVTATFANEHRFEIASQMRRAALGIGSNIAEGCGRSSYAAFRVSLDRAMGEVSELEFQCIAAQDLELADPGAIREFLDEVIRAKKMLAALIVRVRGRQSRANPDAEGLSRREPRLPSPEP